MKRAPRLLTVLLLLLCFPVVVKAHPGKTDSRGGHTDHSTGEYHYHHGYSAHDHYDMDGDGNVDCPYDFNDNTNNRGNSSGSSGKPFSEDIFNSGSYQTPPEKSISDKSEVKTVPTWVYWIFGGLCLLIIILHISNKSKDNEMLEMKQQHKSEIDKIVKSCDAKIAEKQASDVELKNLKSAISEAQKVERKLLYDISSERKEISNVRRLRCMAKEAPLNISFSDDGMPVYWKPRSDKPYGDYTVFISLNSGIYHTDSLCGGYRTRKDHIFNVIGHARPCKKCAVDFFGFTSAPDWYTRENNILDDPSIKINWRN